MGNSLSSNNRAFGFLMALLVSLEPVAQVSGADLQPTHSFLPLGSVTVPEGRWNEVPELLMRLPDRVRSIPVQQQILASAAENYFLQNLLDDSRAAFQKLLKVRRPALPFYTQKVAELRVAEIALLKGKSREALDRVAPLLQDSNATIAEEALLLQARINLQTRQWDALQKTADRLLHQNPTYAEDLVFNLLQGVAALEQKRLDDALSYFKRYPDQAAALYYQGVCYIQKKELSNALPLYQQMLQQDATSGWVDRLRLILGEAFYAGQDWASAQNFFKPVTRPQADRTLRALALHRQACLHFQQKNFAECETVLTFLLKTYPAHPFRSDWTYLYASVPIFQKDWKKAIREQNTALEVERGLAPRMHGVDAHQLKISAEFRILWAHLLLNNFEGARHLADSFIAHYPAEPITSYAYLAKGMAYYRLAEYDAALDAYQMILNKYPDSSACGKAVYLMTLCLHAAHDPFRVAGILNNVHARLQSGSSETADEWTQNTLYWLADAYYQLNDLASAEKIYREFIAQAPQSPLVPYALEALAAVLSAQGPQKDAGAVVALQQAQLRAHDLNNKDLAEQVEVEMAKVYYNQREFAKAVTTLEHILHASKQGSIRAESLYLMGEALSHEAFYDDAIRRWKQLVKYFPKNNEWVSKAYLRIGNTQAGLKEWAEASQTFMALKQAYPGTDAARESAFRLVDCAFNQDDIPLAAAGLISFSKDYPDDPRIPKSADNLLNAFRQKSVTLPAEQQAQLLKLAPGSAGGAALLWERGASLFNEKRYSVAQRLFEKIMLSYPNDEYAPSAYFYDADCFFWQNRWEDAAHAYQNFFLSFPKHEQVPNAMFQKAVSLFRLGDFENAIKDFQAFLVKYPTHALAREASLNMALAYKKAFKLDEAITAYRSVIQHYGSDPKIASVWLQIGSLLNVQGKRREALEAYAKIPAGAPEFAEAIYNRSQLEDQNHHPAETRRLLEALQDWPGRKNDFRVAGLIKLSEIYEQEGVPLPKLRALYQDLQSSSSDPEVVKQAAQRLKELGS